MKVSFRTRTDVDCSRLAGQFGGGGHRAAAGATIAGPMAEVIDRVLRAVRQALDPGPPLPLTLVLSEPDGPARRQPHRTDEPIPPRRLAETRPSDRPGQPTNGPPAAVRPVDRLDGFAEITTAADAWRPRQAERPGFHASEPEHSQGVSSNGWNDRSTQVDDTPRVGREPDRRRESPAAISSAWRTVALGGLITIGPGRARGRLCPVALAEAGPGGRLPHADPAQPARGRRPAIVRDHRGAAGRLGQVSREPVGSVWLIRQPDGSEPPVIAMHVGVPPPGMRRQPEGRRQRLPLPVPHQRVQPGRETRRTRSRPARWTASTWS